MRRINITTKLILLGLILVLIPGLIIGLVGYTAAKKAVYNGIEDRLQVNAKNWKLLIAEYDNKIKIQKENVRETAKDIVTAQAKSVNTFIDHELEEYEGTIPKEEEEEIFEALNEETVGKTGYIWILDYKGNYVLSKGRQRDGENVWNTQDSDGNYVIQDLIKIGKQLKKDEFGYHSYPWLNKGEVVPREKIAAMINIPSREWVIGISTYYDDLVDMQYEQKTMEELKDLIAKQTIGKSGYIWVLDSNGKYVVSKARIRDGENIYNAKDTNGVYFIQEMIKKSKDASSGKVVTRVPGTDSHTYPWRNTGETVDRMKVAGIAYYEPFDWVIGVSAYYDDFEGEESLGIVKKWLTFVIVISTIIGIVLVYLLANMISRPIKSLTKTANKINDGDFDAKVEVTSNDEIADLAAAMEGLVMGIKLYKQKEEECKKNHTSKDSKEEKK